MMFPISNTGFINSVLEIRKMMFSSYTTAFYSVVDIKPGKYVVNYMLFFSGVITPTEQNSLFYFLKTGFDRKYEKGKIMRTIWIYNWRATFFSAVIAATKQNSGCYFFFLARIMNVNMGNNKCIWLAYHCYIIDIL